MKSWKKKVGVAEFQRPHLVFEWIGRSISAFQAPMSHSHIFRLRHPLSGLAYTPLLPQLALPLHSWVKVVVVGATVQRCNDVTVHRLKKASGPMMVTRPGV